MKKERKRVFFKRLKELGEVITISSITSVLVLGVLATIYAVGYFLSQIWLTGIVDQYPFLSDIFVAGTNVNVAVGALTVINVLIILGTVILILTTKKYFSRRD